MRVVVTGATGNVGTSVLEALCGDPQIHAVTGIARRRPALRLPKTSWATADVATDDLVPLFRNADAVVHLAWLIQPSRDVQTMRRTNVDGSERVFRAAVDTGVSSLVYASSVGAYSRGPKDRRVDETWPTEGVPTSTYSRHKAEVERLSMPTSAICASSACARRWSSNAKRRRRSDGFSSVHSSPVRCFNRGSFVSFRDWRACGSRLSIRRTPAKPTG